MLRYDLRWEDVGAIRFAISPLSETARSLRALRAPRRFPQLSPWVEHVSGSTAFRDPLLQCLVDRRLWTPDCLTRVPVVSSPSIADELHAFRALDPDILFRQLRDMHGELPQAVRHLEDPMGSVADAIGRYWSVAIAPHWGEMHRTLEADIAYRGRMITRRGLVTTLNSISPGLRVNGHHLAADVALNRTEPLNGKRMVLMPSVFSRAVAAPTDPGEPMILYAARGRAAIWEALRCEPDGELDKLIGARRSELLRMLASPASSTDLAARLTLSVPAVNQHLRALQGAGLLRSARQGRHVLYHRTALGEALAGRVSIKEGA